MVLSADKAARLRQIEDDLLRIPEEDFNWFFNENDASVLGSNGTERIFVNRRLHYRLNLTHDLFESQEDYFDWHTDMRTRFRESIPINATDHSDSSTAPPGRIHRTINPSGLFKDEKTSKSKEKPVEDESPDVQP